MSGIQAYHVAICCEAIQNSANNKNPKITLPTRPKLKDPLVIPQKPDNLDLLLPTLCHQRYNSRHLTLDYG
jgi:hypothetical protein